MKVQVNSEKIKSLRDQRCWSQQQLAEMSGISTRTLQRLEAKSVASQETIKSLASVFEVDCEELLATTVTELEATIASEKRDEPGSSDDKDRASSGIVNASDQQHRSSDTTNYGRKKLSRDLAIIIICMSFGLFGVFSAYEAEKITLSTFQLLKNSLSIILLINVFVVLFKAYRKGIIGKPG